MSITAQNISYSVGQKTILTNVAAHVDTGRVLGIIGPNGSGKSTLLRCLSGHIKDVGDVEIAGTKLAELPPKKLARLLAVVGQHAEAEEDLRVRDVINLGRIPYVSSWIGLRAADHQIVHDAAEKTGVEHLLGSRYRTLSGGERQRVQIARALAQQTPHIFLDEPTNHLDINYQLSLLELVRKIAKTTIVVLHDLNLAAMFCDEILMLNHGRVVMQGTPEQVLTQPQLKEVFQVETTISTSDGTTHVRIHRNAKDS